jgi:hypothetical protein
VNHGQHYKGIGDFADWSHRYATEDQIAEESTIRLVGSDNLDRVVTRLVDIGVEQSSLRLLKPLALDLDEEKEKKGEEKEEEDQQELSFSLMTTIAANDRREAIRLLLCNLSYTVDEGKGSHAQLVVRINADSPIAEEIAEEARAAGTSVTVK